MFRAVAVAVVLAAAAAPAHGYEFWLRAQTTGQAYQLRDYRLIGPDLFLGRRRYSETLALRIWDIGGLSEARRRARLPDRGLRVSWQSYLRIDHDFGSYASGSVVVPLSVPVRRDALDVTPELGESMAALQLLYGYLELTGIADDRLSLQIGRVLVDDGWGSAGLDGAAARFAVPDLPLEVSALTGLRVRASSPLGTAAYELDGTSGAACQEYVEGPAPGTGSWQLIDRNRAITNRRLASDYELCPQRDVRQPSVGVGLATQRVHGFAAAIGYRRTWSRTVGVFDGVDRLTYPDLGLYPNDAGQAPASGVDEERVWARARGEVKAAGLDIAPYADVRYSLLHAAFDRADAGVRLTRGADTLEPAVEYFYPTFDGDSIFNAFALEPTTDLRLAYRRAGALALSAAGWLRLYHRADGLASRAGGAAAGVERAFGVWRARLDALWDAGYGGRRAGGSAEATWRPERTFWLRGRAIVLAVAPDAGGTGSAARPRYVTRSAVASSTWRLSDGMAVHTIVEADHDALHELQVRVVGVFDFAFAPEM